jgi:phosphopantothenoylcysteine decarboxylase/phosphopantothenate--cysteine ligase
MITAGPTREAIDPVRFISNRSSGKMGYALAEAARNAGARVTLISGPVTLDPPDGVRVLSVESAREMFDVTHEHIAGIDIFIAAAAVADYHPAAPSDEKIKKTNDELTIELEKSPDILASVAALPAAPFTVGFAAETENLHDYARTKLDRKRLNMIIANLVGQNRGFEVDNNAVDVFWRDGRRSFPVAAKRELAEDLVALIAERYAADRSGGPGTELPAIAIRD